MKKILFFLLFIIPFCVNAEDLKLAENAKSAIMIEASTGEVLYEKNSHEKLPPASMTKMMAMLIIMENIEEGNLKYDEMVSASSKAASMGGSQIFLEPGEKLSVKELLKGIAIGSGNDATMVLAERIGGSEEAFVDLMNKKARKLGLNDTNFKNPTGLDAADHYSSAYDMAMIAKQLVKHKDILKFTSIYEDYLRQDSDKKFWLVNTNRLVRFYQGVDGLKTGFTNEAGYCLTATGIRNNMRLITVVMKEPDSNTRNNETSAMLDYGFQTYSVDQIISSDKVLGKVNIEMGRDKYANVKASYDINILNSKIKDKRNVSYKIILDKVKAPIRKGDVVGKANIIEYNKIITSVDLVIDKDVNKASFLNVFIRNLDKIIIGIS